MADPLSSFLEKQYGSESKDNLFTSESATGTIAPTTGLTDTFSRGVQAGVTGLKADVSYFQALGATLFGADELAQNKVSEARARQDEAARSIEGVQDFAEFVDNPTIEGFFTQAAAGVGQIVPSAITTIAGAATGGIGLAIGKGALTASGRLTAKKIVRDALTKTSKQVADPDDLAIAQGAWELYRKEALKDLKTGAVLGAAGTEYVPLAGSNLSEALEAGKELDPLQALRAGLVAAPQAAIGVGGEIALAKLIGSKALKNAGGSQTSVMGRLGRDIADGIGRGGVVELGTEVAQESIAVANRTSLDENYDQQEARLRLGEAAFAAFFGGAAVGGAGAGLGGGVREVVNSPETLKGVMDKARTWLDQGQQQQHDDLTTVEEIGNTDPFYTSPESQADINAQVEAMLDESSSKQAVWVEGDTPALNVTNTGKINANLDINGKRVYGAFIPGRGTIVSPYADIVEEVIRSEASDEVLAIQLGYSSAKPAGADRVVQVKNANGDVISEEVTTVEGLPAAINAAEAILNKAKGDTYSIRDVADVLRERKQKYDAERGPVVRNMEVPEEVQAAFGEQQTRESRTFNIEDVQEVNRKNLAPRAQNEDGEYRTFDNTEELRARFRQVFADGTPDGLPNEIDFSSPIFAALSDAVLKNAIELRESGLEVQIVSPAQQATQETPQPGSYSVVGLGGFDQDLFNTRIVTTDEETGNKRTETIRVPLQGFLRNEVSRATQSQRKFRNITIVRPDGTEAPASLVSLVNAGKRLLQTRIASGQFTGQDNTAGTALLEILGDLLQNGYSIKEPSGREFLQRQQVTDAATSPSDTDSFLDNIYRLAALNERSLESDFAKLTAATEIDADGNRNDITIGELLQYVIPPVPERFESSPDSVRPVDFDPAAERFSYPQDEAQEFEYLKPRTLQFRTDFDESPRQERIVERETPGIEVPDTAAEPVPTGERGQQAVRIVDQPDTRAGEQGVVEVVNREQGRAEVRTIPEGEVDETSRDRQVQTPIEGEVFAMGNVRSRLLEEVTPPTHRYSTQRSTRRPKKFFQKAVETPLGKVPFLVNRLTSIVFRNLQMTRPSALFLYSQFQGLTGAQIDQRLQETIPDQEVRSRIIRAMRELSLSETKQGTMLGFDNSNFLLVDDSKANNELEVALIATHELGHAWFREERSNLVRNKRTVFNALWKQWQSEKRAPDAPLSWSQGGGLAFEEWYVDNIAKWAYGEFRDKKPTNVTESYFKRLVTKLKTMFNEMRRSFQRRFTPDEVRQGRTAAGSFVINTTAFQGYMEDLVRAQRDNFQEARGQAVAQQISPGGVEAEHYVRSMIDAIEDGNSFRNPREGKNVGRTRDPDVSFETLGDQLRNLLNAIRKSPALNPVRKFLYTADSYLRSVGNDSIADMFYIEAQKGGTRGRVGMLKRRDRQMRLLLKRFEEKIGDPNDPEIQRAIAAAAGDASLAQGDVMLAKAQDVREFLQEIYDDYIQPAQEGYAENSDLRIAFQEDYFPIVHNLLAVQDDPNGYISLILEFNPDSNPEVIRRAVQRMLDYQDAVENSDLNIKELDPASNIQESRQLTANVPRERLAPYLVDPSDAIQIYMRQVTKRVEWNRATKAADGTELLQPMLNKLSKEKRREVEDVIKTYLGYGNQSMDPFWRKVNSYAAAAQYTLLLPLAVIGSLPELAGPILNFKDFNGLEAAFRTWKEQYDSTTLRELAEDIGVVANDALQNGYITAAEQEFLDPSARLWTDKFFRITFLDQYTSFTRSFATGMGVQFLLRHAVNRANEPNSERYLRDLGVSKEDVVAWAETRDMTTPQGKRVGDALYKFVESSILRPNSAERPVWASDPRYILIWQLKSYFYAFHKVITTGLINEYETRTKGADSRTKVNTALGTGALFAVATLPLAMMGMELREYVKDATAETITLGANEKDFFRTDKMSWGDYISTAVEKTGIYGPWALLMMAQQSAQWGQGGVATLLGPTAETVEQFLQDGFEVVPDRLIPIYSYLY